MSKVILNEIKTFDINNGYTFTFSYSGMKNVSGNILRIYDKSDITTPLLEQFSESTKLNALTSSIAKEKGIKNENDYIATISMCDENNQEIESSISDKILFYCFTTPTLSIDPNQFPEVINKSSFNIQLKYIRADGVLTDELNEYKVLVYDHKSETDQMELYQTKRECVTDINNLTAHIVDLEGGKTYYLKAVGITVHEVSVSSEMVAINIADNTQYLRSAFNAKIQNDTASVYLTSHLENIDGRKEGEVFYEDGKLIIPTGSTVYFDKDIDLKAVSALCTNNQNNSFLFSCKISNFPIDSDIIIFKDKNDKEIITISSLSNKLHSLNGSITRGNTGCLILSDNKNIIKTNYMDLNFNNNDSVCKVKLLLIIERINGAYNLKTKILS